MEAPHGITWFEIPSLDFARAVKFYSTILAAELPQWPMHDMMMAMLPRKGEAVTGAIVYHPKMVPSATGTVVYLNTFGQIDAILGRVEAAGGKICQPRMNVTPEIGDIAIIMDTEGNCVGLHQSP